MLKWLYRTLFARRSVWVLELDGGLGKYRLEAYDADEDTIRFCWSVADRYIEDGWVVISAPPRPEERY